MTKVIVLIPVYKKKPDKPDLISLLQCFKVLGNHPIILVAPEGLNTRSYEILAQQHGLNSIETTFFQKDYFSSDRGYNKLMLTKAFYERFTRFEYMLIYQLDAFVFADKLLDWCNRGYDYCGAPIFESGEFRLEDALVGNGGFSLRKVSAFLKFFSGERTIYSFRQLLRKKSVKKYPWRIIPVLLMLLCWRNHPAYMVSKWQLNEDAFWCSGLNETNYSLKKPDAEEALEFSLEMFPSKGYQTTGKLPFGCHAWEHYEYESFWVPFIMKDSTV